MMHNTNAAEKYSLLNACVDSSVYRLDTADFHLLVKSFLPASWHSLLTHVPCSLYFACQVNVNTIQFGMLFK